MNILLGHNTILAVAIPAAEWPIRASGLHGRSLFSVSLRVLGLYPGNQPNEKSPPDSFDPLITPMAVAVRILLNRSASQGSRSSRPPCQSDRTARQRRSRTVVSVLMRVAAITPTMC